jgi:UDP-glucose 4-epimerase
MSENEKGRTVLVTGGAGFIGSHIVDGLVEKGHRVLVLDDLSTGRTENVNSAAELHELDIRSVEAAELIAKENVDVLYHLAAQMDVRRSTEDPLFDASVNVLGILNLLQAAVSAAVDQVIFASTGGAIYGEQETFPAPEGHPAQPVSPYGVSKLASERYLFYFHTQYGLNATCLRFANVYGERQNPHGEAGVVAIFMNKLLSGETPTINGDGLQTRDYIHVSDVVAANLAALGRRGFHIYNVGTGRDTDVVELYRAIATSLGLDREASHGPGMPGEQRRSSVDASLLRSELGVPEPLPLADGIARTAEWFRSRG